MGDSVAATTTPRKAKRRRDLDLISFNSSKQLAPSPRFAQLSLSKLQSAIHLSVPSRLGLLLSMCSECLSTLWAPQGAGARLSRR